MKIAAYGTGGRGGQPNQYKMRAAATSRPIEFHGPYRGLVTVDNTGQSKQGGASVLENMWPTERGARLRKGKLKYATLTGNLVIKTLADHRFGSLQKVFAFTDTGIFEATNPVSPTTPIAAIGGIARTVGYHSWTQIQTSGGYFLVAVNGADARAVYDGAAWATTGALQISGVTTSNLSQVWVYGGRVWHVEKNSFNAWYTAVDSIGGAATKFPLVGDFKFGGSLLFGARLSGDSGAGLNDYCIFVSTEGEVAIFAGGDPSTAATWGRVGVYQIGRPLGNHAHVAVNGDLFIATEIGLISLRAAMSNAADGGAVEKATVSRDIDIDWRYDASNRTIEPWTLTFIPSRQSIIVKMANYTGQTPVQWAWNVITKAWSRITGWDMRCVLAGSNRALIGQSNGTIAIIETGSSDEGLPYTCSFVSLFSNCGSGVASVKASIIQAQLYASRDLAPKLTVLSDFNKALPLAPSAAIFSGAVPVWDGAGVKWDAGFKWDAISADKGMKYRSGAAASGQALAACIQITVGGGPEPSCEVTMASIQVEHMEHAA